MAGLNDIFRGGGGGSPNVRPELFKSSQKFFGEKCVFSISCARLEFFFNALQSWKITENARFTAAIHAATITANDMIADLDRR